MSVRFDMAALACVGDFVQWLGSYHPELARRVGDVVVKEAGWTTAYGYERSLVVRALEAGCTDRYQMSNWCDTNG